LPSFKAREGVKLGADEIAALVEAYLPKYAWFLKSGYSPHYWQTLFHTMQTDGNLTRFRHLVAGRRGGKTLSAAWEMVYYLLHPEQFHRDAYGREDDRPLNVWVLTRDYPAGLPALLTVRDVLKKAGLEAGVEYKENRGHRWFEFSNGSFLQFKTADEPDSLRGAGLDILWIDEAAFVPNNRAWNVVSPALGDKPGILITTTTPSGKNWFYDEFWSADALADPDVGRVEYWSIDNPHFATKEWNRYKRSYHPLLFKQEFCASFDAMSGKELHGDWLHYYKWDELPRKEGKVELTYFIGVDPAISLAEQNDRFAIACVGVTADHSQAFLIDQWAGRIPFHEQLDKIAEWNSRFRPQMVGVEAVAYQIALSQQAMRLPGFVPIAQIPARGKKWERILTMSPLFRLARVRIRKDHRDFINEWLDYDSKLSNPKDDCLDSVEIALRTAGALLPDSGEEPMFFDEGFKRRSTLEQLMHKEQRGRGRRQESPWDEHLGSDW